MKIVIAGGSGLIGRSLTARLVADGDTVVVLTRDASGQTPSPGVRRVEWNPDGTAGPWAIEVDGADALINLAGASLDAGRWTAKRKAALRSSRVLSTRSLVTATRKASTRPSVFVQGSAVGFYGIAEQDRELDESFPPGDDFLASLCVDWEAEAHPATALGCRLVILRSGVVLSGDGGVLARLRLPFSLFLGGPVATGRQYMSWVHGDDLIAMMVWALRTPAVTGVFNSTSPGPVTNARFSSALARALGRPSWMPIPAFALRLLFGELADALLIDGQRVVPKRAVEMGFIFGHPEIEEAMKAVVTKT